MKYSTVRVPQLELPIKKDGVEIIATFCVTSEIRTGYSYRIMKWAEVGQSAVTLHPDNL